jgi:hypothetical protein
MPTGMAPGGGIESYVPVMRLPNGRAMLLAPPREALLNAPQIDGIPPMPAFPPGFLNGGIPAGHNPAPVAPFNPIPLGLQMEQRAQFEARQQAYPGPPSIAELVPPIIPGPVAITWDPDEFGRPV